jgi:competence protein ComEA
MLVLLWYPTQAMQSIRTALRGVSKFATSVCEAASGLTPFQTAVVVASIILVISGTALSYLRSRPAPVAISSAESGGEEPALTVHVAGAVNSPGLYRLPQGARVADALAEAGGPGQDARLDDVNLASRVKDGQKILVPLASETGSETQEPDGTAVSSPSTININTAGSDQLETLPGIGPALAERILRYRRENGPFDSVEALTEVEGIGPGKMQDLKGQVTI